MDDTGFYHQGMCRLQDAAGARPLAQTLENGARHDALTPEEVARVARAEFFFIASCFEDRPDVSFRAGSKGFVTVLAPDLLEFPDYDGNYMFRTMGNIVENPTVQLLFIDFDGKSNRLRVGGTATVDAAAEAVSRHVGAKAVVRVHCRDVFPNCPRYIPDLERGERSPHLPREGERPPMPFWKGLPFIAPVLPDGDVHKGEAIRHGETAADG